MDISHYNPDSIFQYQPSKYNQYSLYKGHNVMLRDDEDLGYLIFGNFFDIEGVKQNFPGLPKNICLIGSCWIPLPKYSYDKKKFKLSELSDYYAGSITRLVNTYLKESLNLCVALGVVEVVMDQWLARLYMHSSIATLKTFIDITTVTQEERKILRSCYDHPWSWQERNNDVIYPPILESTISGRKSGYCPYVYNREDKPEGDFDGDGI